MLLRCWRVYKAVALCACTCNVGVHDVFIFGTEKQAQAEMLGQVKRRLRFVEVHCAVHHNASMHCRMFRCRLLQGPGMRRKLAGSMLRAASWKTSGQIHAESICLGSAGLMNRGKQTHERPADTNGLARMKQITVPGFGQLSALVTCTTQLSTGRDASLK